MWRILDKSDEKLCVYSYVSFRQRFIMHYYKTYLICVLYYANYVTTSLGNA